MELRRDNELIFSRVYEKGILDVVSNMTHHTNIQIKVFAIRKKKKILIIPQNRVITSTNLLPSGKIEKILSGYPGASA